MSENLSFPPDAFLEPDGANREEVEALVRSYTDRLLDWLGTAHERAALPGSAVGNSLPDLLRDAPTAGHDLLAEIEPLALASMNPAAKGWIAHMDPAPAVIGWLGEMVSAALNNNMLSVEMSPALSRLEQGFCKAVAAQFGLGQAGGGVMASGGSLANLQALALARNVAFPSVAAKGAAAYEGRTPVILASAGAHTSLEKAAMVLGLGTDAVRRVPGTVGGAMTRDHVVTALADAKQAGETPFCLVATAGTTVTGAIDPLEELADIAKEENLWLHVDAAWAGAMIFSSHAGRLAGIEEADSATFNPQKWCYVPKTSAMLLVRDMEELVRGFRVGAPYMAETEMVNLGEVSIQGTRHAEVFKTWLVMRHLGLSGIGRLVDQGIGCAEQLAGALVQVGTFELSGQGESGIVCFRPRDKDAAELHQHLSRSNGVELSLPLWRGERWLRAVMAHPFVSPTMISNLIDALGLRSSRS